MRQFYFALCVTSLWAFNAFSADAPKPIAAAAKSSLKSAQGKIRQFAFDKDPESYFASSEKPGKDDNFTLQFDEPVALKSIKVLTGTPKGENKLTSGELQVSKDGKQFTTVGKFSEGTAKADYQGEAKLIRILPGESGVPLVIRDIEIESAKPVARFAYPVEFVVDIADAPELKEWIEKVVEVCEKQYPMINEQLKSDGFKPATVINLAMKNSYTGVAQASRNNILGSVKFFKERPDDIGAFVHETAHVVQSYRTRNAPSWLVEGIADYVRFYKYEPGKAGKVRPETARYNASYRTSAAFLNYVAEKYDKDLILKLNKSLREGEYKEEIFQTLTKKPLKELDEEWRESLKKR
jgi:hypothetical protein